MSGALNQFLENGGDELVHKVTAIIGPVAVEKSQFTLEHYLGTDISKNIRIIAGPNGADAMLRSLDAEATDEPRRQAEETNFQEDTIYYLKTLPKDKQQSVIDAAKALDVTNAKMENSTPDTTHIGAAEDGIKKFFAAVNEYQSTQDETIHAQDTTKAIDAWAEFHAVAHKVIQRAYQDSQSELPHPDLTPPDPDKHSDTKKKPQL